MLAAYSCISTKYGLSVTDHTVAHCCGPQPTIEEPVTMRNSGANCKQPKRMLQNGDGATAGKGKENGKAGEAQLGLEVKGGDCASANGEEARCNPQDPKQNKTTRHTLSLLTASVYQVPSTCLPLVMKRWAAAAAVHTAASGILGSHQGCHMPTGTQPVPQPTQPAKHTCLPACVHTC